MLAIQTSFFVVVVFVVVFLFCFVFFFFMQVVNYNYKTNFLHWRGDGSCSTIVLTET